MKAETNPSGVLAGLRGASVVVLQVAAGLALFMLVFVGLSMLPIVMMVIFFAIYVGYTHLKHRGRR